MKFIKSYKERATEESYSPFILTRSLADMENLCGNLYQAISIMSTRAKQLNGQLKEELSGKLNEFASTTDNLEEVFENKEQIEISKFYERMPKPHIVALYEYMNSNTYYRVNEFESPATRVSAEAIED